MSKYLLLLTTLVLLPSTSEARVIDKQRAVLAIKVMAFVEDVPSLLLEAICSTESSYDYSVINHKDNGSPSIGLCQVKLATAKMLGYTGKDKGLLDPFTNARYAAKYLHKQLKRYKDLDKAIAAYNAGSVRNGVIRNTKYVRKVKDRLSKLKGGI